MPQPLCVQGALAGLKVGKVLAGRLSSLVSILDAETLLGWDMAELRTVQGQPQLLPAIYEFTAVAPKSVCATSSPGSPSRQACTVKRMPKSPRVERARKVRLCHARDVQILFDDPKSKAGIPFSRPELFAWASLCAQEAHARKEEEEERRWALR